MYRISLRKHIHVSITKQSSIKYPPPPGNILHAWFFSESPLDSEETPEFALRLVPCRPFLPFVLCFSDITSSRTTLNNSLEKLAHFRTAWSGFAFTNHIVRI